MLLRNILLPGVLLPALGALVALALAEWSRRRDRRRALAGSSLAIGAAFVAAFVAASGWPRFPPVESTQRLFYWVALIALLGFVWARRKASAPPWPLPVAAVAFLLWGMLRSPIEHRWTSLQAAIWLLALLALGWAVYKALAVSHSVTGGRAALEATVVRLAVFGGAAGVLALSGTARLAQLMGAVVCGLLVVEAVAAWRRRTAWRPGDAMAPTVATLGLLLGGYFFAELAPWPAILLVGALLLLGASRRERSVWRLAPLLPLALALGLALAAFLQQEKDPYGEYYGRVEQPSTETGNSRFSTA